MEVDKKRKRERGGERERKAAKEEKGVERTKEEGFAGSPHSVQLAR